jgi:hypothetical protein
MYAFAVFHACINPYLYGCLSFDIRHELRVLCGCAKGVDASTRDVSMREVPFTGRVRVGTGEKEVTG